MDMSFLDTDKYMYVHAFGDGRFLEFYANKDGTGFFYIEFRKRGEFLVPVSKGAALASTSRPRDFEIFRDKAIEELGREPSPQISAAQLAPAMADW